MADVDWSVLHVAGVGPGGDLAHDCEDILAGAEILAGGRRLLERLAPEGVETLVLGPDIDRALDELERALNQGRRTAVLADGDPMHFGVGRLLARRLGRRRIRVHPAVSSMQLAAARLGLPVEDLRIVSLHGRRDFRPFYRAAMLGGPVLALTDAANTPAALAEALIRRGAPPFRATVLERLGLPDERVYEFDPAKPATEFASPNLACFEMIGRAEFPVRPGVPDHAFVRQEGLMTKGPVRAAGLARLGIGPSDTVWDLGAGSGAVSMEASAALPAGGVFAVEADAERVEMIRENRRRTGALLVEIVRGRMPDCLGGLPDPDKIFIGGGLSRDDGVLETAWARLRPGGRLTAHLTLLSGLERVRSFFGRLGVDAQLDLIQASQGADLAGDLRLAALNPVFILTADKEASP